ncbi:MAG TPA: isocitrate lyase/phosphoenolpyruvate mutase family protein [Thermoanaerobaculia bacterium]|nr:isocitrate lyase/phosphoenolpyruvate mutase family protein [Thermoanaerobaculia bacterium]
MSTQRAKAELFRSLHVPGSPIVLFNVWDAGSAKAVAAAGARAIATGSWSVAAASGFADGERIPLDLALDNLARIVGAVELPVTLDLESGYGETAAGVGLTVTRAIEAGAIGCNLEDSFPEDGSLRETTDQVARLAAAREAAEAAGVPFFINARTDHFLINPPEKHEALVAAALDRGRAFRDAGADGFFVPGLVDEALIARVVAGSPLPVNVMVGSGSPPLARLAELGVARVSHGPGPFRGAMKWLEEAARVAMG